MAITTIEILAQQLTPLDPTALVFDPTAAGIIIDRTIVNTIQFTVPPTIPASNIDISTILLGTAPVQRGQPMLLIRATVTSNGGAFVAGNEILRTGPTVPPAGAGPNSVQIQDLTVDAGQYLGIPVELPIEHTVGFDTRDGPINGPHRILMVVKFFEDTDAFAVT